ncbi:hypothetical protein HY78_30885 (plasmid) [Rhizorhabdus wittichii DC-6]|nr:hypothetical protein HY78_30885 [Rhizorhabdus wittichii DC-6]
MTRPRILFLLNHDAAHQAAHVVGIAAALARIGEVEVVVACGTPAIQATAQALVPPEILDAIEWVALDLPPWADRLIAPLNSVAPVKRLARLDRHLSLFAGVDILVSPERTCLRIKRKLGSSAPKFVFVPHGAGDRSVTYHPEMRQFDLMLVSGQKVVDEMAAQGIMHPAFCRIIGYPKFDTIDISRRPRFFADENPVFLYNPHFDPHLSSWYDQGAAVMDLFVRRYPDYNLIVAPHVMLFKKKIHYSLEYHRLRIRPEIEKRFIEAPNIIIDTGSPRLFDMSYTLAADAYIGDVSSQIYEFLSHRGACFFLDTEPLRAEPSASPRYLSWGAGEVYRNVTALAARLPLWREIAMRDAEEQDRILAYTIDRKPNCTAPERGAQALISYTTELKR